MIFKQQLTDISTVLNNTGNTTKLLTSFNALDVAQQKVLLSSSLLTEKQKEQCFTMATLSAANTKYTAEQLAKATGISTETLATWGLIESTDSLTISELAEKAASDAQAKNVLDKIIAKNAEAVANGNVTASNTALAASEGSVTLATGAFTTAIKANIKAMWTWMTTTPTGWLTMLAAGIFAVVKAYDALTVSVKEQKEKMEDSLSAYNDAKNELSNITTELENQEQAMDDLLAKEKLTYAEQGQLEELQAITKELRIQKDLAEKEEGRTQKEVAKDASGLFNKQFGKYDISENAISEYQSNASITSNNAILTHDKNDISAMIAGYRQFNDLLDEAYGSENQEDIDHFKSLTEDLEDSIFDTAQELQEQQSNIADYYNTIKDIPYSDLTTEQKEIVDSYNAISNAIELIYKQLDPNTWKSMQIESVFDTEGIEKTKEELVEMVKAGEFDESTLQSYPKLSEALEQNKISVSELRNELEALAEAESNVQDSTLNNETGNLSLSPTDFLNKFETQYKSALSAVQNSMNQVMEATEDGIELKVDSESAIAAITDIRNAVDEINNSEEIDFNIDMSSVDEFADKLMNALDSGDLNAVKSAYTDFANDVVNSMQDMFGEINENNMQAAQKALESVGILNAEQIIVGQTGYSYEEYSVAKEAAANAGVNLNGTVEEVVAQLDAEGLAASDDAQAIMEYMIKKAAASGMGIDVSGAIAALGEEWEWLQALIEQWGRYNSVSQKGHGNTSGTKNLGSGMYNPVVPEKVETDVEVDLKFPSLDSSAKKAGKSAGKSLKDGLKEQLSDLDSVISGITGRIDDQISSINEQKSATLDSIDAQKEALEEAKDVAVEALEAERDARLEVIETQKEQLEEQIKLIDKQIKQKQDEIDAINDAADARKRELDLQKAQYELERMQNQRTIFQYSEDKGMHYVNDTKGIRDAKESVDDAKRQIEIANIQKEIDLLEDQKDLLNEQIDLLDEQADAVNKYYDEQIKQTEKYYDSLIKNLEKQRKETEAYYESLTQSLEQRKDKFQELTEILEKAELSAKLKQLGIDEEALLNGSEEEFNKLKDAYMNIVFQLNEGNDEVLNKLRELSGYEGTAPAMLEESNTKLGTMNDELGNANTEVGNVNSSLDKTASTTSDVATNVSDVNTNIGETTGLVNEQKGSFDELKQTIDLIVEAINKKIQAIETGQSTVSSAVVSEMANFQLLINKILEVKEKLDSVNDTVATMNRQPIDNLTSAFQLLYDKLLLVSNLLGVGVEGEGAVNGISGAIQALNEISLEEGIIAQFTNLKTAIDSVTAAISGGGGESSEGSGSGGISGSKGGKQGGSGSKGGKGSEGESGGGSNSLTGAIKSMGETAKEVIGEPDAEGDGTVIGEFGSMETAVNDVRDAIGTEGSAGGEGGKSGSGGKGESDDTLVGSIEYLGDMTEEEMGESGGDGIIGRFEEFRDVIGEADGHIQSINKGLDEIDGKEVSCTIHVNIETSGSTGFTGSAQVLGSMNLNSADYNAQYTGNAHYEGTAEVTGDWGVKKGGTTLVGELGQELVVFPNGRFKTVGDNGAEFVDIPANSIVFNHLQTKELLSKGNIVGRGRALASGTALANGTSNNADDSIWTTLADGTKVRPLQPGDKMYDLVQKFDAYFKSMDGNLEKLVPNSFYEHQRQMEDMAKQINYVSSVTNNNRNTQPVVNHINVTCPGVTSQQVAEQLGNVLGKELDKQFSGFHNYTDQRSRMR